MKWQNGNYSRDDLKAMQKDAMDRVREMQRRADETLRRSNSAMASSSPAPKPAPPPSPAPKAPAEPSPVPPPASPAAPASSGMPAAKPSGGRLSQILSAAGMDQDRLIILGLLFVLYNDEEADRLLLLALLYLLL